MDLAYAAFAVFLMLNLAAGLARVLRGPTAADRMLAAQVLGTTGVALMLVLGELQRLPAARDAALVLALLAAIATVAFVRRVGGAAGRSGSGR